MQDNSNKCVHLPFYDITIIVLYCKGKCDPILITMLTLICMLFSVAGVTTATARRQTAEDVGMFILKLLFNILKTGNT